MKKINFNYNKALDFFAKEEVDVLQPYVDVAHDMLHNKTGLGNDFLGWVDLPNNYDKEEFARIKKAAEKIKSDSDVLVVIGIVKACKEENPELPVVGKLAMSIFGKKINEQ